MKKAKIMLSAIAILAVVGGALAFKAQNFTGKKYCTIDADQPILRNCTSFITDVIFVLDPNGDFRVSETSNTVLCNQVTCPTTATEWPE